MASDNGDKFPNGSLLADILCRSYRESGFQSDIQRKENFRTDIILSYSGII